jgi:1-acyl-sn-glycerol-3-phosphate acyltransferase
MAAGVCFIFFGIGGVFLGYVLLPIIRVVVFEKNKRVRCTQYIICVTFNFFCKLMSFFQLIKYEFIGFDKLSSDEGIILIANHPTLIDYVVIVSKLKQCNVIVKESLWNNRYMNKVIAAAGYIPNTHASELMELVRKSLIETKHLLIFPEGTRTTPGEPILLQRGAAQLAIRLPAKVRMLRITTSSIALTKKSKWYNIPKETVNYRIEVSNLIDPLLHLEESGSTSLAARHLTQYFTRKLEKDI